MSETSTTPAGKRHPLRKLREAKGWTQPSLSRRAAVSVRTIGMVESYCCRPQFTTQRKLLHALGLTWEQRSEVFGDTSQPVRHRARGYEEVTLH